MEKLSKTSQQIFYRGTIIIIKDAEITPKGTFDKMYAMIAGGLSSKFEILDLYRGIGGVIFHDIKPNLNGHFAVNKEGIKNWVIEYFKLFYTEEGFNEWTKPDKLDEIIYVDDLSNYFKQANRDLFMK